MLDDLYRDLILEHYRHPLGGEAVDAPDRRAEGQNPLCGDECALALDLEGERLRKVEYRARGCSISVASGSMMVGEIEGRTLDEVRALEARVRAMLKGEACPVTGPDAPELGDLEALEGVSRFPVRVKCALLPWTTLDEALSERGLAEGGAATVSTEEPSDADDPAPRRLGGPV